MMWLTFAKTRRLTWAIQLLADLVRSEGGFKTINKSTTTGAITETGFSVNSTRTAYFSRFTKDPNICWNISVN